MTTTERPAPVRTVVASETYLDHDLAIVEMVTPAHRVAEVTYEYSYRAPIVVAAHDVAESVHRYGQIDGRSFRCPAGTNTASLAKLRKYVDVEIADAAILPRLLPLVGRGAGEVVETLAVGDVVAVHAMGYWRHGIVTAIKRTRVEVAYTTASSAGRVFRKAVARDAVREVTA